MARKEKTLRDLSLDELRQELGQRLVMLDGVLDLVVVNPKLDDDAKTTYTDKLKSGRTGLKEAMVEFSRRFHAPSTYDNEKDGE